MKNTSSLLVIIAACIIFPCSCRLTRADVIGTWVMPKNDTLYILPNNVFKLNKSSTAEVAGKWGIHKTVLTFNFDDTLQKFGGLFPIKNIETVISYIDWKEIQTKLARRDKSRVILSDELPL